MGYTRQDVITPANAITLLGLLLSVAGAIWLNTLAGLIVVFFGRMLDLVDGPVARATRTTKFSVYFDPVADKLALLAILIAIFGYKLAPLGIILFIFIENLLISGLSGRSQARGNAIGAVIPGKLNMFFQQSALLWFVFATVMNNSFSGIFELVGYAAFIFSLPFGIAAVMAYTKQGHPEHKSTTT